MTIDDRLTIDEAERQASNLSRQVLLALREGKEGADNWDNFVNGRATQIVTQDLYDLAKVREVTLSIVASTGVITCDTGFDVFAPLKVGDQIAMSGWSNGGNNVNRIISAKGTDSITLSVTTGLVDETDTADISLRVRAKDWQLDIVQRLIDFYAAVSIPMDAVSNVAVTTAERRDEFRAVF